MNHFSENVNAKTNRAHNKLDNGSLEIIFRIFQYLVASEKMSQEKTIFGQQKKI